MREYGGFTRKQFGEMFRSRETTVCEWEHGHTTPLLAKLVNIARYFGVSLDCIVSGKAESGNSIEELLCRIGDGDPARPIYSAHAGKLMTKFRVLPAQHKERLMGYLDALYRETAG